MAVAPCFQRALSALQAHVTDWCTTGPETLRSFPVQNLFLVIPASSAVQSIISMENPFDIDFIDLTTGVFPV